MKQLNNNKNQKLKKKIFNNSKNNQKNKTKKDKILII